MQKSRVFPSPALSAFSGSVQVLFLSGKEGVTGAHVRCEEAQRESERAGFALGDELGEDGGAVIMSLR